MKKGKKIGTLLIACVLAAVCALGLSACDESADTSGKIADLLTKYETLSQKYDTLSENNDTLKTQYDTVSKSCTDLDGKYTGLKGDLDSLSENYEGLSEDLSELEGSHGALEGTVDTVGKKVTALESSQKTLSENLGALQTAHDGLSAAHDKLAEAQTALKEAGDKVAADVAALKTKFGNYTTTEELNGLLETIRERLSAAESNYTALEGRVAALETEVGELSAAVANVQSDLTDLQSDHNLLKADFDSLNDLVQNYRKLTPYALEKTEQMIHSPDYLKLLMDDPAYPFVSAYAQKIVAKYTVAFSRAFTVEEVDAIYDEAIAALAAAPLSARLEYIGLYFDTFEEVKYSTASWDSFSVGIEEIRAELGIDFAKDEALPLFNALKADLVKCEDVLRGWEAYIGTESALDGIRYETLEETFGAARGGDVLNVKAGTYQLAPFTVAVGMTVRPIDGGKVVVESSTAAENGTAFLEIAAPAAVSFEGITFKGTDHFGIACQNYEIALSVKNCTFDGFVTGLYAGTNSKFDVTGSTFTGGSVGIGTETVCVNLSIDGNIFNCSIEAVGVTAALDSYANYVPWAEATVKANHIYARSGEIVVHAYGRFNDGVWLVKAGVTDLESAIAGAESGDVINITPDTYTVAPFMIDKDLNFFALGEGVVVESSTTNENATAFIEISAAVAVRFEGIAFAGTDHFGIACQNYENRLDVKNCAFDGFFTGLYAGTNSVFHVTDSSFTGSVGIGSETLCANLVIENNTFDCTIEAVGFTASCDSYANYVPWAAATVKANKLPEGKTGEIVVNAYGRFNDGVWLVKTGVTEFVGAVSGAQSGDIINVTPDTYTLDAFTIDKDLKFYALGEDVILKSSAQAAVENQSFITIGQDADVLFRDIVFRGVDSTAISCNETGITLNVDSCTLDGFPVGIYSGKDSACIVKNSNFKDYAIGIKVENVCANVTITDNEFVTNNNDAAVGFTKEFDTFANWDVWQKAIQNNNSGFVNINTYGTQWKTAESL